MSNVVKIIDQLEMVGFLKINGTACRFVSLISDTPVVKIKKDCPYKGVRKVAKKTGIINANYNTAVRKRIADKLGVELQAVEYVNGDVWYKHLQTSDTEPKNLPVVVNKTKEDGKFYIQFFPHHSSHKYVLANGEEIAEELLKPYFYKESPRADFKPCVISIGLDNVKELRASGVILQAPDLEEAEKILALE